MQFPHVSNKVMEKPSPEIKIFDTWQPQLDEQVPAANAVPDNTSQELFVPQPGTGYNERVGAHCKLHKLKYSICGYREWTNNEAGYEHESNYFRLIIFLQKQRPYLIGSNPVMFDVIEKTLVGLTNQFNVNNFQATTSYENYCFLVDHLQTVNRNHEAYRNGDGIQEFIVDGELCFDPPLDVMFNTEWDSLDHDRNMLRTNCIYGLWFAETESAEDYMVIHSRNFRFFYTNE